MVKIGDEVVCSARWLYGWYAVVIELGNGMAKVRWNDRSIGESWVELDWLYRQFKLREFGARPYPMPFVRNSLTVGFQRWCIGAYDKRFTWAEWKAANCRPERLGKERIPLGLFSAK